MNSCNVLIHSSEFSPFCLLNLWNCSDFIVSLIWGLNLFVRILNKPSNMLHVPMSACVSNSMNCRPFLPNQVFTIASCSAWGVLYVAKILLTSNLKFLNSLYLSSASELKLGCFIAGQPILGPAVLCGLSAVATVIAVLLHWALLPLLWLLPHLLLLVHLPLYSVTFCIFAYVCLSETFTPDTM